jgi:hypothetical protein
MSAGYGPRAARRAAGLTVAQTARRARRSEGYIRHIERQYDRVQAREPGATLASPAAQRAHCRAVGGDIDNYYRFQGRNAHPRTGTARPAPKS